MFIRVKLYTKDQRYRLRRRRPRASAPANSPRQCAYLSEMYTTDVILSIEQVETWKIQILQEKGCFWNTEIVIKGI